MEEEIEFKLDFQNQNEYALWLITSTSDLKSKAEVKYQYIHDEIEILIESLKVEIDKLHERTLKKVDTVEERLKRKSMLTQSAILKIVNSNPKLVDLTGHGNLLKNIMVFRMEKLFQCGKHFDDWRVFDQLSIHHTLLKTGIPNYPYDVRLNLHTIASASQRFHYEHLGCELSITACDGAIKIYKAEKYLDEYDFDDLIVAPHLRENEERISLLPITDVFELMHFYDFRFDGNDEQLYETLLSLFDTEENEDDELFIDDGLPMAYKKCMTVRDVHKLYSDGNVHICTMSRDDFYIVIDSEHH